MTPGDLLWPVRRGFDRSRPGSSWQKWHHLSAHPPHGIMAGAQYLGRGVPGLVTGCWCLPGAKPCTAPSAVTLVLREGSTDRLASALVQEV